MANTPSNLPDMLIYGRDSLVRWQNRSVLFFIKLSTKLSQGDSLWTKYPKARPNFIEPAFEGRSEISQMLLGKCGFNHRTIGFNIIHIANHTRSRDRHTLMARMNMEMEVEHLLPACRF